MDYTNFMSNQLITVDKEGEEWRATIRFSQSKFPVDGKWQERTVTFSAKNKEAKEALVDMSLTFASFMVSCDSDLFSAKKGLFDVKTDGDKTSE